MIPTTNPVSSYQLIGADSIYFPKGGLVNRNQLTLTINAIKDSTFSDTGVKYILQQSVVSSIVLIKQ